MSEKEKDPNLQGSLAHEQGSGAPCLKCGPKCEGLDLHFWRKTCKNCRCKEEDHKVTVKKFDIQKSILENIFPGENITDDQKPKSGQALSFGTQPVSFGTQTTPSEEQAKNFPRAEESNDNEVNLNNGSNQDETAESFPQPPDLAFENMNINGVANAKDRSPSDPFFAQTLSELDTMSKYMQPTPKDKSPQTEEGAQYHQKQLIQQLPAHDFDENLCDGLTDEEKEKMKEFNKKRNEEASGKGAPQEQTEIAEEIEPCVNCNQKFQGGGMVIFADRAGPDKRWHPECFVCHTCKELLVDLIYFYKDGNIYCGRHYGELTGLRCDACDELIFSQEYTIADGKNYHLKHFCCYECDKELGGESYVPKDDHPYCMDCYRVKFSKTCHACQQSIPPDVQCLSYEDCYWHSNEACFSCCVCKANLIGQQFIFKDKKAYCSAECVAK